MSLQHYLAENDPRYDEQRMICMLSGSPGYHTQIPVGTPAHPTRDAMNYALALLQSGEAWRNDRACDVIERIAELQVTDPTAEHYGIWGWFLEEPPQQMAPADWNWAEFIGAQLAQALICHGGQLRAQTAAVARIALQHAALSLFRRNASASYTNIAVMGGVTAVAAGEVLDLPFLIDYGRTRLGNVVKLAEELGGFTEYNSPTYTRVALEEAERGLLLLRDSGARAVAERLRYLAWETFAGHFHPGTGQIAGPQSRAYSDHMLVALARYLSEQTGASIVARDDTAGANSPVKGYHIVPPLPCPAEFTGRFGALPSDPLETTTRFGKNSLGDRIGTSYFTSDMTLGSVNHDFTWVQRRPLLGYWRTDTDRAVVLRARLLKDGRDFCAYTWQAQRGPRVLSVWCLTNGAGDFHPSLDRRSDCTYPMSDLRVRITLQGRGVSAVKLADNRFALTAGDRLAIVHTAAGRFESNPVSWAIGGEGDAAWVEAELYHGPQRPLDCRITPLVLSCAIEVIRAGESPRMHSPLLDSTERDQQRWTWNDLSVTAPVNPVPFVW